MKYVCDAPGGKTWFRIETEAEAASESAIMRHAVEKYFRQDQDAAATTYQPDATAFFEREIGLKAHIQREMALFLTLRDDEGNALATAMLPPAGKDNGKVRTVIVGPENSDPYPTEGEAIQALADHFGIALERARCFPYHRA
jgi:hypothetical protein